MFRTEFVDGESHHHVYFILQDPCKADFDKKRKERKRNKLSAGGSEQE